MSETIPSCPACQSTDVVPIAYGLPTSEGFAAAERGEVELGGCVIGAASPRWRCRACGEYFGDHQDEAAWWRNELKRRQDPAAEEEQEQA
jgi:hypothetical protein